MGYDTIRFDRERNLATITLNRPEVLNSLSKECIEELSAAIATCESDADVRAVIITGAGKAFCAGADVRLLAGGSGESGSPFLYRVADDLHERIVMPIRRMAKPVIAAVNGVAAGAGFGLALCCDVRLAATEARFTIVYSNIGLSPDCGTSYFLPRLIGQAKTMELYLFNDRLSAEQALSLGVVNRVVAGGELMAAAKEMAQRLAAGPSFAYGQTKLLLDRSFGNELATQLKEEARAVGLCAGTDDHREGLAAFLAKRPPQFAGH